MTERQYNKLQAQIQAEYRDQLEKAAESRQHRLEALDWVRGQTGGNRAGTGNGNGIANGRSTRDTGLIERVRSAIPALPGETFTAGDLAAALRERHQELNGSIKRRSVSSALRRLAENRTLEVAQEGSGRRPVIYKKVLVG